jgi:hypothetical protein
VKFFLVRTVNRLQEPYHQVENLILLSTGQLTRRGLAGLVGLLDYVTAAVLLHLSADLGEGKASASNILAAPRRLACTRGAWIGPSAFWSHRADTSPASLGACKAAGWRFHARSAAIGSPDQRGRSRMRRREFIVGAVPALATTNASVPRKSLGRIVKST